MYTYMYILFAKHVMSVYVTVMVSLVGYWLWRYLSAIDIVVVVVAVAAFVATSLLLLRVATSLFLLRL